MSDFKLLKCSKEYLGLTTVSSSSSSSAFSEAIFINYSHLTMSSLPNFCAKNLLPRTTEVLILTQHPTDTSHTGATPKSIRTHLRLIFNKKKWDVSRLFATEVHKFIYDHITTCRCIQTPDGIWGRTKVLGNHSIKSYAFNKWQCYKVTSVYRMQESR